MSCTYKIIIWERTTEQPSRSSALIALSLRCSGINEPFDARIWRICSKRKTTPRAAAAQRVGGATRACDKYKIFIPRGIYLLVVFVVASLLTICNASNTTITYRFNGWWFSILLLLLLYTYIVFLLRNFNGRWFCSTARLLCRIYSF